VKLVNTIDLKSVPSFWVIGSSPIVGKYIIKVVKLVNTLHLGCNALKALRVQIPSLIVSKSIHFKAR
jgi:hypothetical protein